MLKRMIMIAALGLMAGPVAAQTAPITVFVVRHAEKGPETPDPSLTEQGKNRAGALAQALKDAGVTAAYASEFKRTQETVAPLAAARSLTTTIVPAARVDSLVKLIAALPAGSRAVVASHSNLVHLIAERLTGIKVPPLTEADYDRMLVVTVTGPGKGEVVVLRYGEK